MERLESRTLLTGIADGAGDFAFAMRAGGVGFGADAGHAVVADKAGNFYVAGYYYGTADFDTGADVVPLSSAGGQDIFVAKYSPHGALAWARGIGGAGADLGIAVAVAPDGSVYVTGEYSETVDFDPGVGEFNLVAGLDSPVASAAFVLKMNSAGQFVWARSFGQPVGGGPSQWWQDRGNGIAVAPNGSVVVVGDFMGVLEFGSEPGALQLTSAEDVDGFVACLTASGDVSWAKQMSEAAPIVEAPSLAVTPGNDILLVGFSNEGAYLIKLSAAGEFQWTKVIGDGYVSPTDIALGQDGVIHTVGMFVDTADFNPGIAVYELTAPPLTQGVFLSKLTSDGDFLWAGALLATEAAEPGNSDASSWSLAVDAKGNVLTTGQYSGSVDFDPSSQIVELNAGEESKNAFLLALDANGQFNWVKQFVWLEDVTSNWWGKQGSGGDDIALAPDGGILVTGSFIGSLDFDPGDQVFRMTSNATPDMFVAKLAGARTWTSWTHPCDANADGWIVPADALLLINELNIPEYQITPGHLLNPPPVDMPAFFDPTGDGRISPLDVLTIINYLNLNGAGPLPNGEGEPQAEGEYGAPDSPGPSSRGLAVAGRASGSSLALLGPATNASPTSPLASEKTPVPFLWIDSCAAQRSFRC